MESHPRLSWRLTAFDPAHSESACTVTERYMFKCFLARGGLLATGRLDCSSEFYTDNICQLPLEFLVPATSVSLVAPRHSHPSNTSASRSFARLDAPLGADPALFQSECADHFQVDDDVAVCRNRLLGQDHCHLFAEMTRGQFKCPASDSQRNVPLREEDNN